MKKKKKETYKNFSTLEDAINYKYFYRKFKCVTINNDIPVSFTEEERRFEEGTYKCTNAKEEGRSGRAIAVITPRTLAVYKSENIKYVNPVNWTKTIDEAGIFQKCHIIAYSLCAKINDSDNIFIGTAHLNKKSMKNIETEIYNEVKNNNRQFLYKVTPVYIREDYVPIGVLIEAETIDNLNKITRCRFCYNIQRGYKINYYDGSNKPIEKVLQSGREVIELKEDEEMKSDEKLKYRDYIIDITTNTFHSFRIPCEEIKNLDSKYKQETTADKNEVLAITDNNGKPIYSFCKKCLNIK